MTTTPRLARRRLSIGILTRVYSGRAPMGGRMDVPWAGEVQGARRRGA
jgi:hypothetical protein